jgi:hypothetical protein
MCACAVVIIVAFFLLGRHVTSKGPGGDPRVVNFFGPDHTARAISLDSLRVGYNNTGSNSQRANDAEETAKLDALCVALAREVSRQCPDCFLTYEEQKHHVPVKVDLFDFLADPELIANTARVPLHATPSAAIEDDDSADSSFDEIMAANRSGRAGAGANATNEIVGLDQPGARLPLVAPRIYPNRDDTRLVTNKDKISVCANRYVHARNLNREATLPTGAHKLLDAMYTDFVKKKTCKDRTAGGIKVSRHSESVENVPEGTLVANVAHGKSVITVVAAPSPIRVCWGAEATWTEYAGPFTLPLGKWCVRAESLNRTAETCGVPVASAQVFTVEQENSK